MDAPWIVVLALLGAWLVTAAVLGFLYWRRGDQLTDARHTGCLLQQEVRRLRRDAATYDERERLESMSDDDLLRELLRPDSTNQ